MNFKRLILIAMLFACTNQQLKSIALVTDKKELCAATKQKFTAVFSKIKEKLQSPQTYRVIAKAGGTCFLMWLIFNTRILAHELGHGLAYKAITGTNDNTKIFVGNHKNTPYLTFSLASIPIQVCSHSKNERFAGTFWHPLLLENWTKLQKIVFFAAGPIAGASASYAMMSAIEMYEQIKNKKSLKEIIASGTIGPFLMIELLSEEKIKNSLKSPAKLVLAWFLWTMMLLELHNLFPFRTICDGYKICKALNVSPSLLSITTKIGKFLELQ